MVLEYAPIARVRQVLPMKGRYAHYLIDMRLSNAATPSRRVRHNKVLLLQHVQ
jgi:hypothetical protein